jgi:hypothetical protein
MTNTMRIRGVIRQIRTIRILASSQVPPKRDKKGRICIRLERQQQMRPVIDFSIKVVKILVDRELSP